jgi:predicted dehydrogenase
MNGAGNWRPDHACVFGEDCGSPQSGINEDSSSAIFEFKNGTHGVYTQVFYTRRNAAARGATVSGYHGTLSFDWYKNEMKIIHHHKPYSDVIKTDGTNTHFGGDISLARNFIDVIERCKPSESPITAGIQSVYTCLAAKESAASNKFVSVRQVGAA